MAWFKATNTFEQVFKGSLILKGFSGALEFIAGAVLLIFSPDRLRNFINLITQRELLEDSNDLFANALLSLTNNFSNGTKIFLITYLWVHAVVKLVAVIGILRNERWAYPFSLLALGILTGYQIYSLVFVKISMGLLLLTVFDLFVLWMIWREKTSLDSKNLS